MSTYQGYITYQNGTVQDVRFRYMQIVDCRGTVTHATDIGTKDSAPAYQRVNFILEPKERMEQGGPSHVRIVCIPSLGYHFRVDSNGVHSVTEYWTGTGTITHDKQHMSPVRIQLVHKDGKTLGLYVYDPIVTQQVREPASSIPGVTYYVDVNSAGISFDLVRSLDWPTSEYLETNPITHIILNPAGIEYMQFEVTAIQLFAPTEHTTRVICSGVILHNGE